MMRLRGESGGEGRGGEGEGRGGGEGCDVGLSFDNVLCEVMLT